MYTNKRGQAAVTDLFISLAIFIILITITTLTWNLYSIRLSARADYDDMLIKAFQVNDLLVKSKGIPSDWYVTPGDVPTVLGLAENERILSSDRVKAFKQLSDNSDIDIKSALKIGTYNYYFVIHDKDGNPIISTGSPPAGKYTVNLARIVQYKDEAIPAVKDYAPVTMEFAIWK